MASVHLQIVDKPKCGIYIWGTKTSFWGGFFGINIHFGTYNSLHLEMLGFLVHFVIAVGDWHHKYRNHQIKEDSNGQA